MRNIGREEGTGAVAAVRLALLALGLSGVAGAQVSEKRPQRARPVPDPERNTGVVSGLQLREEPRVLWKYAPARARFTDLVAYDGIVIAVDRAGALHALDAATGELVWKRKEGPFSFGWGLALTRTAEFDVVVAGGDSGLFALERKTGKPLWRTAIASGVHGPTCTADAVFAGGSDGYVYACDLRTGKIKWKHGYVADRPESPKGFDGQQARFTGRPARPTPAATDGETVFLSVFDQCRTLAIDAATGERRWSFATQGWMHSRPTVGKRDVYVASQDQHFYAVDKHKGTLSWKVKTRARNEAAAAVTQRLVVFGSCDGDLYAADRIMGSVVWSFATDKGGRTSAPIYSQPLVSADTVYLPAMRGKIYALELRTGELKWKLQPLADSEINSDPRVDGGRLFLTTRRRDKKGESAVLAIGSR